MVQNGLNAVISSASSDTKCTINKNKQLEYLYAAVPCEVFLFLLLIHVCPPMYVIRSILCTITWVHVRLTVHPACNPMGPCTSYGPSCAQSHGSMYVLRSILREIPWVHVHLTVHPARNPHGSMYVLRSILCTIPSVYKIDFM